MSHARSSTDHSTLQVKQRNKLNVKARTISHDVVLIHLICVSTVGCAQALTTGVRLGRLAGLQSPLITGSSILLASRRSAQASATYLAY